MTLGMWGGREGERKAGMETTFLASLFGSFTVRGQTIGIRNDLIADNVWESATKNYS